jgi:hypothetical protein
MISLSKQIESEVTPMGKFCSNCGTALAEGVAFCSNCGTPVPQAAPAAPQFIPAEQATPAPQFIPAEQAAPAPQFIPADQAQPQFIPADQAVPQFVPAASVVPAAPAKKKPSKKALIIGGVVAAVAVVAIILFIVLGGGAASSPQAALDNYLAVYNGDTSKLEAMAPAEYWEYGAREEGMSKKELLAEMKEEIAENAEEMKEEYGKNFKITGKIMAEDDLDKDTVKKIAEALSEYGIKSSSVKAGKDLTVKLTLKSSEGNKDQTGSLTAIQIGSSWYLIRYYESDGEVRAYFIVN